MEEKVYWSFIHRWFTFHWDYYTQNNEEVWGGG